MIEKKIWNINILRMKENETNKRRKAAFSKFSKFTNNFGIVISGIEKNEKASIKDLYFLIKLSSENCKLVWDNYQKINEEALFLFSNKNDFVRVKDYIINWAITYNFEITTEF